MGSAKVLNEEAMLAIYRTSMCEYLQKKCLRRDGIKEKASRIREAFLSSSSYRNRTFLGERQRETAVF